MPITTALLHPAALLRLLFIRQRAAAPDHIARRRRQRAELASMQARDLADLGIGCGEIPALLDAPLDWRRDRR